MTETKRDRHRRLLTQRIMLVAARDFLEYGYTETTMRGIAARSKLSSGSVTNLYDSKDDILCGLVQLVIDWQFDVTERLLQDVTDDSVLTYATETVLQLHIAELNENLREVYCTAYTLPKSAALLQNAVTARIEELFHTRLPGLETKDFYRLEIASGGIMRGFMIEPCSSEFTMEEKVRSFLESSLMVYRVPHEEIQGAIAFVKRFDFPKIARETVDDITQYLDDAKRKIFAKKG